MQFCCRILPDASFEWISLCSSTVRTHLCCRILPGRSLHDRPLHTLDARRRRQRAANTHAHGTQRSPHTAAPTRARERARHMMRRPGGSSDDPLASAIVNRHHRRGNWSTAQTGGSEWADWVRPRLLACRLPHAARRVQAEVCQANHTDWVAKLPWLKVVWHSCACLLACGLPHAAH